MPAWRIIFMGTADLARTSLAALRSQPDCSIVAVVTQPDRARGRDLKLQPSPVKALALQEQLPILQPAKAREPQFIDHLRTLQPDLIVVAAYGQILPEVILRLPRFGCINVHASLLPRYRGAAPIQWALLNDEPVTGVTIMNMDAGVDTGDILTQTTTPISAEDDAQSLHDRLARLGAELLVQTIPRLVAGTITPRAQPADQATHARKIQKEDGHVDWSWPARSIWCRSRAFTPWPGLFTYQPAQPAPLLLKLFRAAVVDQPSGPPGQILAADKTGLYIGCGTQTLQVAELQAEGRRRMPVAEFLAGHRLSPGERLN